MNTHVVHRSLHITASVLALLAAIVITYGVIPDVRTDPTAQSSAVPALQVIVVCNVLVSIAVLSGAFMGSSGRRRLLLGSAATLAFLVGFVFLDAAFTPEGLAQDALTMRIFLCVLADLAAGGLIVLAAVLRANSPSLRLEREAIRQKQEITERAHILTLDRPGTTIEDNWSEAVEMYNRRYFYPAAVPQDQTIGSPGNGEVGTENGDLASTRSG